MPIGMRMPKGIRTWLHVLDSGDGQAGPRDGFTVSRRGNRSHLNHRKCFKMTFHLFLLCSSISCSKKVGYSTFLFSLSISENMMMIIQNFPAPTVLWTVPHCFPVFQCCGSGSEIFWHGSGFSTYCKANWNETKIKFAKLIKIVKKLTQTILH